MEFVEIEQEKSFVEIKIKNEFYILSVSEKEYITKLIKILKVDAEIKCININEALEKKLESGRNKGEFELCDNELEVIKFIIKNSNLLDLTF